MPGDIRPEDWERLEQEFGIPIEKLNNKLCGIDDNIKKILFTLKNPLDDDKGLLADVTRLTGTAGGLEDRVFALEGKTGTKNIVIRTVGGLAKGIIGAIVALVGFMIAGGKLP